MRRTIGICFFMAMVLGGAMLAVWTAGSSDTPDIERFSTEPQLEADPVEVTEQWEVAESMALRENARYVIGEKDGFLVVYESDGSTVYLETNIRLEHLSQQEQETIKNHIFIRDDRELYDFLESYTS